MRTIKRFELENVETRMTLKRMSVNELSMYDIRKENYKKAWYISELVIVKPEFRNRGFGSKLLKKCTDWALENDLILALDAIPYASHTDDFLGNVDNLVSFYKKRKFELCSMNGNSLVFNNKREINE